MNDRFHNIKNILNECNNNLNQRGDLPSYQRQKIYSLFNSNLNKNLGHIKRAKLELLCAWKTLHIWESCPFTDNLARELLEISEQCLQEKMTTVELSQKSDGFYFLVDDLISEGEEYLDAAYAGFACAAAVNAVLYDIDLNLVGIPDQDKEPEDWLACANACDAYSSVRSWKIEESNVPKRREFWEWFLNQAVPSAWNYYPE